MKTMFESALTFAGREPSQPRARTRSLCGGIARGVRAMKPVDLANYRLKVRRWEKKPENSRKSRRANLLPHTLHLRFNTGQRSRVLDDPAGTRLLGFDRPLRRFTGRKLLGGPASRQRPLPANLLRRIDK